MLTKSNFMQFLRCSCELRLVKQRQDLVLPTDPALQRIFDEGNVVDAWAQKLFPGGVSFSPSGASSRLHVLVVEPLHEPLTHKHTEAIKPPKLVPYPRADFQM